MMDFFFLNDNIGGRENIILYGVKVNVSFKKAILLSLKPCSRVTRGQMLNWANVFHSFNI